MLDDAPIQQTTASEGELSAVHKLLASWASDLLQGRLTRTVYDAEGNPREEVIKPTAADIGVIRAFLKDNNVTAPASAGTALDELRQRLVKARSARQPFNPERDLA